MRGSVAIPYIIRCTINALVTCSIYVDPNLMVARKPHKMLHETILRHQLESRQYVLGKLELASHHEPLFSSNLIIPM